MEERAFYEAVHGLLVTYEKTRNVTHREGCLSPYEFLPKPKKRGRWGPRTPGNGRFPGHGLVRWFGPNGIHVNLTSPKLSGFYTSPEQAIVAIRAALT